MIWTVLCLMPVLLFAQTEPPVDQHLQDVLERWVPSSATPSESITSPAVNRPSVSVEDWQQFSHWTTPPSSAIAFREERVLDSIYCYALTGTDSVPTRREYHLYNESGLIDTLISETYDSVAMAFVGVTLETTAYDDDNNIIEEVTFTYLDTETGYVPANRALYSYAANGMADTVRVQQWSEPDQRWERQALQVVEFNAMDLPAVVTQLAWNGDIYENETQLRLEYDAEGNIAQTEIYLWLGVEYVLIYQQLDTDYVNGIPTLTLINAAFFSPVLEPLNRITTTVENGLATRRLIENFDPFYQQYVCAARVDLEYNEFGEEIANYSSDWMFVGRDITKVDSTHVEFSDNRRTTERFTADPFLKSWTPSSRSILQFGDNDLPVSNTSEFYDVATQMYVLNSSFEYFYDSNENIQMLTNNRFDQDSGVLVPFWKLNYSRDSLERIVESAFEFNILFPEDTLVLLQVDSFFYVGDTDLRSKLRTFDVVDGVLMLVNESDYIYNAEGLLDTLISFQLVEGELVPNLLNTFTYDANGFATQSLFERYENGMWIPGSRTINTPDEDFPTRVSSSVTEDWDGTAYVVTQESNTRYDEFGNATVSESTTYDIYGTLILYRRTESEYDAEGFLVNQVTFREGDVFDFVWQSFCRNFYSMLPVGIFEPHVEQALQCAMPNPYLSGSSIDCKELESGASYDLRIYAPNGQLIQTQRVIGGTTFRLDQLPAGGIYLMELTHTRTGQRGAKRVMVVR